MILPIQLSNLAFEGMAMLHVKPEGLVDENEKRLLGKVDALFRKPVDEILRHLSCKEFNFLFVSVYYNTETL